MQHMQRLDAIRSSAYQMRDNVSYILSCDK